MKVKAANGFARAEKRAGDVGRKNAGQPIGSHVLDPRLEVEDAGVVDECCDRPEPRINGFEQPHDIAFDRHVRANRNRFSAAAAFDVRDNGLRGRLVRAEVHAHGIAALGSEASRRGADPAAAARDTIIGCIG